MKTLLIIGGTGFFGKSFLDSFRRGYLEKWQIDRVIAMSRQADQLRVTAPKLLDERVELINADVGKVDYLPFADYVIHAAASTDARNYLSRPEAERKNIQAGVYNYCRLAPKFHTNSKIVYLSSGAVYGVQSPNVAFLKEDSANLDLEDMPEHKRDYAIAKRDAERAFELLCEQHGLSASIARCFAFVGPWLPRDQHFAIGNFLKDGLEGRSIHVKARCPVYRSYMHADELVRWLMVIACNANKSCQVFNVGSEEAVSVIQLAKMIADTFSVPVEIPDCQHPDDVDRYIPSVQKAKCELGLENKTGVFEAIKKTIKSIESVEAENNKLV